MKRKDIVLIVAVAFFSGMVSLLVSKFLFTGGENRQLQAQIVQPISAEFPKPDEQVFNEKAINPTQIIKIGDGGNKRPF